MATSSKVTFKLDMLKEKAAEAIDLRIAKKQEEVDSYDSPDALEQRILDWRNDQEKRLRALVDSLPDLSHVQLAGFRIHEMPKAELWERRKAEIDLRHLQTVKAQMMAKADSLVPDADGNIALTKTQLHEFFGI
jgi:hypothetical protein